jgi:hypothetical protein
VHFIKWSVVAYKHDTHFIGKHPPMHLTRIVSLLVAALLSVCLLGAADSEFPLELREDADVQGYEFTEKNKQQIMNALRGAASLMKFLHEKNFFKLLTSVSAVAGPIFTVAITVLNIVFMFIEIESPEMKQLKIEFERLNNRLDQWTEEFSEIKRMIDWNAIQISFGKHERSIRTMADHLTALINSPEVIRDTQRDVFFSKYESSFLNTAEKLYNAMVNTDMIFSENLFRASQVYSEYHRTKVQHFMMGNFQLLLKAVEIQASYIQLRYNSTNATEFTKNLWEKKFIVLRDRMQEIDSDTSNRWKAQSEKDLDSLLAKHFALSNQQFEQVAFNEIAGKYDWRQWSIVTYKDIGGWDNHAALHCSDTGTVRFRSHGRNVQMASVEPDSDNDVTAKNLRTAVAVLDHFERHGVARRGRSDYAKLLMDTIYEFLGSNCNTAKYIGVVAWGANVWYMQNGAHLAYRKICVQGTGHCFNTFLLV